jgi:hypothetical protein
MTNASTDRVKKKRAPRVKFTDADKAWWYCLWHVLEGRIYFNPSDLQLVAKMERHGLIRFEADYDGFEIYPTDLAAPLQYISRSWEQIWRRSQEKKS